VGATSEGAGASFADEHLERAIRSALDLGAEDRLRCEALEGLTRLEAVDAHIEDLGGVEALVNLEELYVYGNNAIRDVTPLASLTSLRDLNLARNEVEDVGPLSALSALTSLSLYGNPVRDLAPLGRLTRLQRLNLEQVPGARDLTALGGLAALTRLDIGGPAVVDLRPLATLGSLERLSLRGSTSLSDIGPVRHLRHLETLLLGGSAVADLGPLADATELVTLGLESTYVRDLSALIGLPHLSRLDLRGNPDLVDIGPLIFHPTLGKGDAVRLERTGVNCSDVAALREKEVAVLATCR
jgi:internalin A